ncbi:MAG TPA: fused MFS/spermidine synthase, partial [bacterium]|nr:fused MFS/spermidine synthase [bacterium]
MSGAVLLALEIVASRIIAPFFGNSIYVWGSLIGVFLAALALGYFLGGQAADRWPSLAVLAGCVFLAGALVVPIPVVAPRVLEVIILRDPGPRISPLVGSLALFFLPGVVIGMVSPFAVRLRARTVDTIGNVAGALYALSTLGSIAGTLLASFVLIAVTDVSQIVYALGAALLVLA